MCFSTPSYKPPPAPTPAPIPEPPKLAQPEALQDPALLKATGNRAGLRVDLTNSQGAAPTLGNRSGLQVS